MIKAIFYTRFHIEKGTSVLHQVPSGAIVPFSSYISSSQAGLPSNSSHSSETTSAETLFDFSTISDLLIPRQEFCDRLVTICVNKYRVIGHPVCIQHSRYDRNEFIFNLAMVLDEDVEFSGHTSVVRKMARMLRNLEEQRQFLSREEDEHYGLDASLEGSGELDRLLMLDEMVEGTGNMDLSGSGLFDAFEREGAKKVYALCEMIMEDLNNYSECMIPIDPSNTINLKLFPTRALPAPVYAWHVPLSTVDLTTIAPSSDLTLTRAIPYIDGVSSVAQIAQSADTDLKLTRKAIQHLLYYGCVLLLDIFQFGAIYAPTAEMGTFVEDSEAQEEAVRYVCMGTYRRLREAENTAGNEEWAWRAQEVGIDRAKLVSLYTTLKQGYTLRHWCSEHCMLLSGIDVRRFITFGVIKGFLYRVHKYVIASGPSFAGEVTNGNGKHVGFHEEVDEKLHREAPGYQSRRASLTASSVHRDLPLKKYMDGMHCLDEVCTELHMNEKKVLEKMKAAFGDANVHIVHR